MALNLSVYRGNTDTRTVTVTSGGSAFDLTNYVIKFTAKQSLADTDAAAKISKTVTVSSPATGIGTLALSTTDTNLPPGAYPCEIKLYKADDSYIKTLDVGLLTILDVVLLDPTPAP
jgi:hypothetical protein